MSTPRRSSAESDTQRRRLSRQERRRQLLDRAWQLVREEGTDALTLGRLAELSDITKPVVYDHFATRDALLAALYEEYDARQTAIMDAAIEASEATLPDKCTVIAASYVDCVLTQGREIPGVSAALAASPELEKLKREYHTRFMEKCRKVLAPFANGGSIGAASLWALLGAAESVSYAAAHGAITASQAKKELAESIAEVVARSARKQTGPRAKTATSNKRRR